MGVPSSIFSSGCFGGTFDEAGGEKFGDLVNIKYGSQDLSPIKRDVNFRGRKLIGPFSYFCKPDYNK